MRAHRLPPVDTTGYVACAIDTPIIDFDDKSPLPCIIVTPSESTEYHIAFHHKDSPLKHVSFAAQQQKQRHQREGLYQPPRSRRAFLSSIGPFNEIQRSSGLPQAFDIDPPTRTSFLKPRIRTALILAIPIFIVACHLLATTLLRSIGQDSPFFGGRFARGGLSSVPAHLRTQRDPQPEPVPMPLPSPVPVPDAFDSDTSVIQDSGPEPRSLPITDLD